MCLEDSEVINSLFSAVGVSVWAAAAHENHQPFREVKEHQTLSLLVQKVERSPCVCGRQELSWEIPLSIRLNISHDKHRESRLE